MKLKVGDQVLVDDCAFFGNNLNIVEIIEIDEYCESHPYVFVFEGEKFLANKQTVYKINKLNRKLYQNKGVDSDE